MHPITTQIRALLAAMPNLPATPAPLSPKNAHHRPAYTWLQTATKLRNQTATPQDLTRLQTQSPNPHNITESLWTAYLLSLANHFQTPLITPPEKIESLWQSALAHQSPAAHLHPFTEHTQLDTFIYDELTALHPAFALASLQQNSQKLNQVQHAIHFHVQNTQPDHTTTEPWALAAFAKLDPTQTFASQQLHDALFSLNRLDSALRPHSIIAHLLAEAAAIMDNADC